MFVRLKLWELQSNVVSHLKPENHQPHKFCSRAVMKALTFVDIRWNEDLKMYYENLSPRIALCLQHQGTLGAGYCVSEKSH